MNKHRRSSLHRQACFTPCFGFGLDISSGVWSSTRFLSILKSTSVSSVFGGGRRIAFARKHRLYAGTDSWIWRQFVWTCQGRMYDVLENYNGWKEYERPVKNYLEVVISENSNGTYLFHSIDKPKRRIINE